MSVVPLRKAAPDMLDAVAGLVSQALGSPWTMAAFLGVVHLATDLPMASTIGWRASCGAGAAADDHAWATLDTLMPKRPARSDPT